MLNLGGVCGTYEEGSAKRVRVVLNVDDKHIIGTLGGLSAKCDDLTKVEDLSVKLQGHPTIKSKGGLICGYAYGSTIFERISVEGKMIGLGHIASLIGVAVSTSSESPMVLRDVAAKAEIRMKHDIAFNSSGGYFHSGGLIGQGSNLLLQNVAAKLQLRVDLQYVYGLIVDDITIGQSLELDGVYLDVDFEGRSSDPNGINMSGICRCASADVALKDVLLQGRFAKTDGQELAPIANSNTNLHRFQKKGNGRVIVDLDGPMLIAGMLGKSSDSSGHFYYRQQNENFYREHPTHKLTPTRIPLEMMHDPSDSRWGDFMTGPGSEAWTHTGGAAPELKLKTQFRDGSFLSDLQAPRIPD